MEPFTLGITIILCGAGLLTAISMLNIFSYTIGHETQLHDLRNHVKELHFQHAVYLARVSGQISAQTTELDSENGDVQIIEDIDTQSTTNGVENTKAQILQPSADPIDTAAAA